MDKYIIKDIRYMIYEYCLPMKKMDEVIISLIECKHLSLYFLKERYTHEYREIFYIPTFLTTYFNFKLPNINYCTAQQTFENKHRLNIIFKMISMDFSLPNYKMKSLTSKMILKLIKNNYDDYI